MTQLTEIISKGNARALTRPTGSLGTLYDEVASYAKGKDPIREIERMAQPALDKRYIGYRTHLLLQHRLPFHGLERKTLEKTGQILGVNDNMVRHLESETHVGLRRYYLNEESVINPLSLSIYDLPWDLTNTKRYGDAIYGLVRLARESNREPTTDNICEIILDLSAKGEPALLKHLSRKSLGKTYEVFEIAKIEPQKYRK